MSRSTCITGALSLLVLATPARAHDASQVRHELRDRGYYEIQFLVAEPPHFQVNACHAGERYHLHLDYYGNVRERRSIGPCRRHWWSWSRRSERDYRDDRDYGSRRY